MRIVATDRVPAAARTAFAQLGDIEIADDGGVRLSDAEILIVRAANVDAGLIARSPSLRVIARTGAGIDTVDVAAATSRGIPVLFAPDAGIVPVAEGTLALVLATAKRLGELSAIVRNGGWSRRYEVEPLDLDGATLGIVGLGRIGTEVARLAASFGMRILAHEPTLSANASTSVTIELVALEELVARSDVVTLHCDLNETTRKMINRRLLARFKPGAILINAARGGVVESEDVLLESLDNGRLAAVGLDVFADEPPDPSHPIVNDSRVVCTPHSVGLTRRWNERVFASLAGSVEAVLRGERPDHVANPEVLPLPRPAK